MKSKKNLTRFTYETTAFQGWRLCDTKLYIGKMLSGLQHDRKLLFYFLFTRTRKKSYARVRG